MPKLPGIYIPIQGDFGPFKKDLDLARAVAREGGEDISKALNGTISTTQAQNAVTGLYRNLSLMNRGAQVSKAEIEGLKLEFGELASKAGLSESALNKLQQRMLQTRAESAAQRAMQSVQRATGMTAMEMVTLKYRMGDVKGAMSDFSTMATTRIRSVVGAVISLKGALAGLGLGMLAKDIFQAGAQAEGLEKAFEAITGSSVEAGREMAYLRKVADELGLNFYSLAESYKGLLVSGAGTTIFEGVVNASAALQLSGDAIKGVLLAVEQMASKGVVSMEELRKQMGERLPGSFEMAANAMGMTAQEFSKAVAQGKILSSDLLPALGRALTDRFGKAARENATSAARAVDKFQEAWTDLKVLMAESGFLDAASESMRELAKVFKDPSFQQSLQQMARSLGEVAKSLAEVAKYAGLRSVVGTYSEGSRFAAQGLIDAKAFQDADVFERQRMVDEARARVENAGAMPDDELAKRKRGVGDFYNYRPRAAVTPETSIDTDVSDIARGLDLRTPSAAVARSAYDPEESRAAIAAGSLERFLEEQAQIEKNLELERDFYAELGTLSGNNEAVQRAALEREYEVYAKVIHDKEALAQWLYEREMRLNKDWRSGAVLALREYGDEATNAARNTGAALTNAFQGAEESLVKFAQTGKLEFRSLVDSIIADLARMQIRQSITGPIAQGLGSLFAPSADGNVFDQTGLVPFAKGGIVTRPTVFPFANGIGLMGEAGPEAIMPLKRGADGKLGVAGGGNNTVVNVVIENHSGEQVQKRQTTNSDGSMEIRAIIGGAFNEDLQSGGMMTQALESTYQLKRRTA